MADKQTAAELISDKTPLSVFREGFVKLTSF